MKKILFALIAAGFIVLLSSCGNKLNLTINDERYKTEISVPSGLTVEEILKSAEISLGEKDAVYPGLSEKPVAGDVITVKRFAEARIKTEAGEKDVSLCGATVADALTQAGIRLKEDEHLNVSPSVYLSELTSDIIISRLYSVIVQCDGKKTVYYSDDLPVREFLAVQGLTLGDEDRISASLDSMISDLSEIIIQRVTKETRTEKEIVPYETQKEYDSSLEDGETSVVQKGVNGEKTVTYEIVLVDGTEESRTELSESVDQAPVPEILRVGTYRAPSLPDPPTEPVDPSKIEVSRVAVYDCDGSGHGYYVITFADGHDEYEEF